MVNLARLPDQTRHREKGLADCRCVVIKYVLFASMWILGSDWLASQVLRSTELLTEFSIFKGWLFVAVTGGLLWMSTRKMALRTAVQQEQVLTVLDNLGTFVFVKDLESRYRYANRAVGDLFELPVSKIIGHQDCEFFTDLSIDDLHREDRQVIESGQRRVTEHFSTVGATGRTHHFITVKLPLRNANGDIEGVCGISTDITQLQPGAVDQQKLDVEKIIRNMSTEEMLRFTLTE